MNSRVSGFIAGALTTTVVATITVSALASTGQVSFNLSAIQFNGQQVSAKGENYTIANGSSVPSSITYTDEKGGGTTYLPARRISEMMGVEIGYDAASGSVTVTGDAVVSPTTPPSTSNLNTNTQTQTLDSFIGYNIKAFDGMFTVRGFSAANNTPIFTAAYRGDMTEDEFIAYWVTLDKQYFDNQTELLTQEIRNYNLENSLPDKRIEINFGYQDNTVALYATFNIYPERDTASTLYQPPRIFN